MSKTQCGLLGGESRRASFFRPMGNLGSTVLPRQEIVGQTLIIDPPKRARIPESVHQAPGAIRRQRGRTATLSEQSLLATALGNARTPMCPAML